MKAAGVVDTFRTVAPEVTPSLFSLRAVTFTVYPVLGFKALKTALVAVGFGSQKLIRSACVAGFETVSGLSNISTRYLPVGAGLGAVQVAVTLGRLCSSYPAFRVRAVTAPGAAGASASAVEWPTLKNSATAGRASSTRTGR